MQQVKSFEDLQQQISKIRALRLGFITNFFPDPVKHALWIKKGDCFIDRVGNTLFIIKKSPNFWNVFYASTAIDGLSIDLTEFQKQNPGIAMMFDLVGREIQCLPLVEMFKEKGCKEVTSLVRMTRMTEPMEYKADNTVRYAREEDITLINQYLHIFFDERTEQIPYEEELLDYTHQKHILICEEDNQVAGFLVFEINSTTLYLRYWFTHPDFRDKKIGSRLLRRFFEEGRNTKRQLFWVIQTNDNAIKRYKHYGFKEENMYDYVMARTVELGGA